MKDRGQWHLRTCRKFPLLKDVFSNAQCSELCMDRGHTWLLQGRKALKGSCHSSLSKCLL